MAAGEFKTKCLAVLDDVKTSREPVLITKRGKPVARLVSLEESLPQKRSVLGRLKNMGTIHGNIVASDFSDAEWERIANEPWPQKNKRQK
jgi:prevent-host-death family protein